MYNTNGDKSVVACRNNLKTAYLWIIETAKPADVYKFSELCGQNIALLAFSHGTKIIPVLNSVPIKCCEHLSTVVEWLLNITVHSKKIFASLYYMNFTSTDDGINM